MQLSCLPVSFFADLTGGRMTLGNRARWGRAFALDAIDMSVLFFPDLAAPSAGKSPSSSTSTRSTSTLRWAASPQMSLQ